MKTQKLRSLMGNQRKPLDAWKRDLLSRTDSMGTVSCAIFDSLCGDPAPGCGHLLAALRAEAESSLRSLGAGRGTGRWQLCGSSIGTSDQRGRATVVLSSERSSFAKSPRQVMHVARWPLDYVTRTQSSCGRGTGWRALAMRTPVRRSCRGRDSAPCGSRIGTS